MGAGAGPSRSISASMPDSRLSRTRRRMFLRRVRDSLESGIEADIDLLGPAPAPMERRAGRHRAQLLLIARRRLRLKALLDDLTTELRDFPGARKVRWTIDVDPVDLL